MTSEYLLHILVYYSLGHIETTQLILVHMHGDGMEEIMIGSYITWKHMTLTHTALV